MTLQGTSTAGPPAAAMAIADLAEILFCSDLQPSQHPTAAEVRAAVAGCLRSYGAVDACACELAHRYGEDPETACSRMRWCRRTVAEAFARSAAA
jgi:uncharacterized membrane protein